MAYALDNRFVVFGKAIRRTLLKKRRIEIKRSLSRLTTWQERLGRFNHDHYTVAFFQFHVFD